MDEIQLSTPLNDTETLKDFTDGFTFKNNDFFKTNPNSLKIILYQDAFEVANPIGSAKKKHKLLPVYMSLGNLPDNFRSHINCIKLVALCKENDFDHDQIYGKIVEDIKILENQGININGDIIKGSIAFICGDNLGSHSLGGFVENFSKSKFICRFCLATREEFFYNNGLCKIYEYRTPKNYENSLKNFNAENKIVNGIKFNSIFNQLKYFHVCAPGLPQCLGHDLFEGVVACDLMLYINYFIKRNWFTLSWINARITNFNYTTDDRKDAPCTIKKDHKKIPGGACQIWNFLRLFSLLVRDKIKDIHDDVWKLVVLMGEIVEIVVSPEIHRSCLPYLQTQIFEYLTFRSTLFPNNNLICKHHYLSHYPFLINLFGPLIKVWIMRFESKHKFFKRAIRYSLNFINVVKSLSVKHELL